MPPIQRNLFAKLCDTPKSACNVTKPLESIESGIEMLSNNNKMTDSDVSLNNKESDLSVLTCLNLSKRIRNRSVSDTNLNKDFGSIIFTKNEQPSMHSRSLSVGDIPNSCCMLDDVESTEKLASVEFLNAPLQQQRETLEAQVHVGASPKTVHFEDDPCLLSPMTSKILADTCSTPAFYLGRQSMSPITKSTKRMPKAMQVSLHDEWYFVCLEILE